MFQPAVDAVRPQVVHEVAQYRVREEVFARAVRRGRQARPLEREAEHHGIEVREMRWHVDDRPLFGDPLDVSYRPVYDDPPVERAEIEGAGDVPQHLSRRHERADEGWNRLRGELVDSRAE